MPTTPLENEEDQARAEEAADAGSKGAAAEAQDAAAKGPVTFIPHGAGGSVGMGAPVKIRTGKYGELDEHELLHLLDSIEDERARSRFRESIYISFFLCSAVAWVLLYGPVYLWHAPQLINPSDVLKNREVLQLNAPVISQAARRAAAPKAVAKAMDQKTLAHLHASRPLATPEAPPRVAAVTPTPPNLPPTPAPQPSLLPNRPAPPVVADAPQPSSNTQPATKPNFGTPGNASDAMRSAMRGAGRGEGSGSTTFTGRGGQTGGGVEVLSDMQGVDFTEYLNRLQRDVYRNWIPLLPEETQPPLMKQGETFIRFMILPGGEIGAMHLDGPSGDVAIDKAAWGSIISEGQFPPLPKQFHGPNLELRFHYMVNKGLR